MTKNGCWLRKHISLTSSSMPYLGLPCFSHTKVIPLSRADEPLTSRDQEASMSTWFKEPPFHNQLFHLQTLPYSKIQMNSLTPNQELINRNRKLFHTRRLPWTPSKQSSGLVQKQWWKSPPRVCLSACSVPEWLQQGYAWKQLCPCTTTEEQHQAFEWKWTSKFTRLYQKVYGIKQTI